MDIVTNTYLPGDPRLVDEIVYQLKSQGIFDQFRKECFADVDTKPAYQNLRQRVEGSVTKFLRGQSWRPDMNKNQVREMLRKSIYECGYLETGVERIVDQVVNPKINTIFLPKVEEIIYKYLGIEKPNVDVKNDETDDKPETDLLPNDLEAVSPESDTFDKKDEKEVVNIEMNTHELEENKIDEDESPPFEPLEESILTEPQPSAIEENSLDSHLPSFSAKLKDYTKLSTNESYNNELRTDYIHQDSINSQNSSESRLSMITSEDNNSKMEICDDSQSKSSAKNESDEKKSKSKNDKDRKYERDKDRRNSKDTKRHSSTSKDNRKDRKDSKSNRDKDKDKERSKSSSSNSSKHTTTSSNSTKEKSKSNKDKEKKSNYKDTKPKDNLKTKSTIDKSRKDYNHGKDKPSTSNHKSRDKKKDNRKDDHYSAKDKKNERRSTDRDSNDGQSNKSNSNSTTDQLNTNTTQKTEKNTQTKTGNGHSGDVSDNLETLKLDNGQKLKLLKPKCASNLNEAMKLMKIRKQLTKLEKQNQLGLVSVEIATKIPTEKLNGNQIISQDNWDEMETKLHKIVQINHSDDSLDDCKYFQENNYQNNPNWLHLKKFLKQQDDYLDKLKNKSNHIKIDRNIDKLSGQKRCIKNNNNNLNKKRKLNRILDDTKTLMENGNFTLPLSPADSDLSGEKKEDTTVSKAKISKVLNNQRYSSDDLYKPRLIFSSSRRRNGRN